MSIRTLKPSDALQAHWEELVYTEARLLQDKNASDLAPDIDALLKQQGKVATGQFACWRAEIVAQAGVDAGNDALDTTVGAIDRALLHIDPDRDAARYRRYFAKPANEILRLGLESQLEVVRTWPASLKGEPEKELKQLGKQLAKDIAAGDDAIAARKKAAAATADHRVRKIVPFVEATNAARQSIYGELIKRGEKKKLGKGWAEGFFRRGTSRPAAADTTNGAPATSTPADASAPA